MLFDHFKDKQYFQAWAVGSAILFAVFYRWPGRKLDHIPAIGYQSHILSFIGGFGFLLNARGLIERGCREYGHGIFKVPNLGKWLVVVNGAKYIEDLRKAPEDVLSFHDAVENQLQIPFTLGPSISKDPVHEEVVVAFNDVLPLQEHAWLKVKAMDTMMPIISRASNCIFVGTPLCRDPDYMGISLKFTMVIVKAAVLLSLVPPFLRPLASRFFTNIPSSIDQAAVHIKPLIDERQRNMAEYGKEYPGKPNDMLSWLMDEAQGEEATLHYLARRLLTVNFAAIHTSTITFTHALLYLAAYPEYIKPLREEVQEIVDQEGWTHSAISRMIKVDSFIKESMRLNSLGCLLMERVARQPFTFSDGTYIPKGTVIAVASQATHLDNANYPDPNVFDPLRFVDKTKKENAGRKVDMVSTHSDFVAFGHGRHACPGRFFAANELKIMLAHVVMNYDVKLEGRGGRPENMWFVTSCIPNPKAEVLFRKRVD
ncbi:putative cytochrome p450 [Lyophyllum shimeji]|uniref:Cytochrome p450 n=1 Tax=Lyophyllum shimeji TaxID=47721 RepID=A0A9P3UQB3_LYOSH|nr:putative cytochrome p450 [Lyophyllum shimeji]